MKKTVDARLPGSGWARCLEAARDDYWLARRRGLSENDAISRAVDAALALQEDAPSDAQRMQKALIEIEHHSTDKNAAATARAALASPPAEEPRR